MNGFLHLAFNASFLVQVVMITLIGLSVWSWVIIFVKRKELKMVLSSTMKFNQKFWSGIHMQKYYMQIKEKRKKTSIEQIFYVGWNRYEILHGDEKHITPESIPQTSLRAMQVAIATEHESLESDLQTLATIASVSPYIGLLGTVWGIMNSFQSLSQTSQTTIALVAPGISEALIATALGLIAAIPAVIAYNKFNRDIARIILRYDNFSEELTELLQRTHIPEKDQDNENSKLI
ncbi:MAG: protein TolQ [Gammaproteobacteria bacterium]|jgi:biopolymer transport protein TolQ|nr:protein TolQ [Gammaproteobacteria bacterium]|tara:strand:- start:270 stop:971 length:702 start_codon:yes stop_codon:yes gene_type:complete